MLCTSTLLSYAVVTLFCIFVVQGSVLTLPVTRRARGRGPLPAVARVPTTAFRFVVQTLGHNQSRCARLRHGVQYYCQIAMILNRFAHAHGTILFNRQDYPQRYQGVCGTNYLCQHVIQRKHETVPVQVVACYQCLNALLPFEALPLTQDIPKDVELML